MSSVAIELSRRGYVVMAVDPYTIGRSEIVNTPDVGVPRSYGLPHVHEVCGTALPWRHGALRRDPVVPSGL